MELSDNENSGDECLDSPMFRVKRDEQDSSGKKLKYNFLKKREKRKKEIIESTSLKAFQKPKQEPEIKPSLGKRLKRKKEINLWERRVNRRKKEREEGKRLKKQ